ncbi:hypothetical protein CEXT_595341 [Caerostris extrusa]|uniref:Uncharacterized protein n=1 Tax=Caerostris extrusa TaxID=172846 RepID=A0AAV4RVH8_CAEEX|nr:hypothetical protein CEXT_595341 [Caerostris extrusa]
MMRDDRIFVQPLFEQVQNKQRRSEKVLFGAPNSQEHGRENPGHLVQIGTLQIGHLVYGTWYKLGRSSYRWNKTKDLR